MVVEREPGGGEGTEREVVSLRFCGGCYAITVLVCVVLCESFPNTQLG